MAILEWEVTFGSLVEIGTAIFDLKERRILYKKEAVFWRALARPPYYNFLKYDDKIYLSFYFLLQTIEAR